MATIAKPTLRGCEGFRLESSDGLLGWVEETWLGPFDKPAALAIRTVDGRDGLLLEEDVDSVSDDSELVLMRPGALLLELDMPRIASADGLSASWSATGEPLEPPPEPPGAVDRALLELRPWRLAPPPRPGIERPFWQQVAVLYSSLAFIVSLVIGVCFLAAWLASGQAY